MKLLAHKHSVKESVTNTNDLLASVPDLRAGCGLLHMIAPSALSHVNRKNGRNQTVDLCMLMLQKEIPLAGFELWFAIN